jgi:hypothetical protein
MKIFKALFLVIVLMFFAVSVAMAAGFDEFGYNRTARVFVGEFSGWYEARGSTCAGIYCSDLLVMKWNKEWDRGNSEEWSKPPYNAEENNEWNGAVNGGSGEVWHYKIVWVGLCGTDGTLLPNGGYCIWGQFEVIMDQGTSGIHDGTPIHEFLTKAIPAGYGAYFTTPLP